MAIMRYIICILLFILFSGDGYSQVAAIQNESHDIIYLCVANPVTIAVENTSSESLIVTTDNGRVNMDSFGRSGHYNIWPDHLGIATIYIRKKTRKGLKLVASIVFRVERVPVFPTRFVGKNRGEIAKSLVCFCGIAPVAVIRFPYLNGMLSITNYTLVVYRGNVEIFKRDFHDKKLDPRVDSATWYFYPELQNADKLIIKDIIAEDCDGELRKLEPIELTITEAEKFHRGKSGEIETIVNPCTGLEQVIKW